MKRKGKSTNCRRKVTTFNIGKISFAVEWRQYFKRNQSLSVENYNLKRWTRKKVLWRQSIFECQRWPSPSPSYVVLLEQTNSVPSLNVHNLRMYEMMMKWQCLFYVTGPFNQSITSYMNLRNPTDKTILFKIKTTAPKKYCVRPNSGHLQPKEMMDIASTLKMPFEYK